MYAHSTDHFGDVDAVDYAENTMHYEVVAHLIALAALVPYA